MKKTILGCLSLLLVAVSINAQSQQPANQKYEALLEKVKAGDTAVSFKDLEWPMRRARVIRRTTAIVKQAIRCFQR